MSLEPTSAPHPLDRKGLRPLWLVLIGGLVAWALINLQWGRGIAWDEVEFLRATDWVRQGQVPYRDFFEHHTPLAWFLMAPFEALSHGPGVRPVLWLRWLQVPMWGVALWRVNAWIREDGESFWSRYLALGCLLGTPFFVFSALEYRVDTLGTLLVILALDRLRRSALAQVGFAGGLLAASVMANLRFGPLAVVVALAASTLDLPERRWRFQPRRLAMIVFGAALALVPWLLYMMATRSLQSMWHWCVDANRIASEAVQASRDFGTYLLYPISNWDLPGVLLELGLAVGGWRVLKNLRRPRFIHLLLLAQVANLAFIGIMKVQFLYHFELSLCLATPFLAMALDWAAIRESAARTLRWAAPGALLFALLVNGNTLATANDHSTLAYQDQVLKRASKLAPAGSTVLDGCGWLIDSRPAYHFWFLPVLARILAMQHRVPHYTPMDLERNPPTLVIANTRLENMTSESPGLSDILTTHYLPVAPNLWVPGLSRAFTVARPRWTWKVLADGDYQLVCSPLLARHPWFDSPFAITTPIPSPSTDLIVDPTSFPNEGAEQIRWWLDGKPVAGPSDSLKLTKGQSLSAEFMGTGAIGVMLVRKGTGPFFTPPPPNLTLDYITFNSYWPHP